MVRVSFFQIPTTCNSILRLAMRYTYIVLNLHAALFSHIVLTFVHVRVLNRRTRFITPPFTLSLTPLLIPLSHTLNRR